jgi:argininosuccinate synthase
MKVVLAYSGSLAASVAVAWLTREEQVEVVTLTLDVGQLDDVNEVRARALACGAVRAHVIDAREDFARTCILPALQQKGPIDIATLAHPLLARTLMEVAAIEGADAVAFARPGTAFEAAVVQISDGLPVFTPARPAPVGDEARREYARNGNLPIGTGAVRPECHLLVRPSLAPAHVSDAPANLEITFDDGVPIAINGVPLTLPELLESLSLIAGQHGIGQEDVPHTPALALLRAAYERSARDTATVEFALHKGVFRLTGADERETAVVTHS